MQPRPPDYFAAAPEPRRGPRAGGLRVGRRIPNYGQASAPRAMELPAAPAAIKWAPPGYGPQQPARGREHAGECNPEQKHGPPARATWREALWVNVAKPKRYAAGGGGGRRRRRERPEHACYGVCGNGDRVMYRQRPRGRDRPQRRSVPSAGQVRLRGGARAGAGGRAAQRPARRAPPGPCRISDRRAPHRGHGQLRLAAERQLQDRLRRRPLRGVLMQQRLRGERANDNGGGLARRRRAMRRFRCTGHPEQAQADHAPSRPPLFSSNPVLSPPPTHTHLEHRGEVLREPGHQRQLALPQPLVRGPRLWQVHARRQLVQRRAQRKHVGLVERVGAALQQLGGQVAAARGSRGRGGV